MSVWCIHERDGEWARTYGDPCIETVEAPTKRLAERIARRSTVTGRWAVQVGSRHVPPMDILLGKTDKSGGV